MRAVIQQLIPGLLVLALTCALPAAAAGNEESVQATEQAAEPDLCDKKAEPNKLPERVQSSVHEGSCRMVRWLDSLFGNSMDFDEEAVGGKLSLGMSWNEFEDIKAKARYRVRSDLPNFNDRWDAFLGRVDEDTYISDTEPLQESSFRQGISGRDDNDWLLGLGYRDRDRSGDGWDYSIGLRIRTPIRLYVKAKYRKSVQLSDKLDLRFRQTIFWRDGTGFGTTSHVDTARELSNLNLLRWEMFATIAEDTDGARWWAGNTWYHNLGKNRGVSLLTFARGETNTEVPLHEYGFELTLRRQITRDWLYINVGPTLTWPRLRLDEKRQASLGFAVLLDFEFGPFRRQAR